MSREVIKIFDYISSNNAETTIQGDTVYNKINPLIKKCLDNNDEIEINFDKINNITTAFLNNSIGKLFYDYDNIRLLDRLSFTGFSTGAQIKSLKLTLSNALALSKLNNNFNS